MTFVGVVDGAFTSELRRSVLRPAWDVGTPMFGDTDPHAVHVAAVDDGVAVSACVLVRNAYPRRPEVDNAWQLRGMATSEEHRGKGFGALVVEAALEEAAGHGAPLLWLEAREYAIGFYEHLGFVAEGPVYLHPETRIPHRVMVRDTPEPRGESTSSTW